MSKKKKHKSEMIKAGLVFIVLVALITGPGIAILAALLTLAVLKGGTLYKWYLEWFNSLDGDAQSNVVGWCLFGPCIIVAILCGLAGGLSQKHHQHDCQPTSACQECQPTPAC